MHRDDIPIQTPCGEDWTKMTSVAARARLCAACDKVVRDVSAMSEAEVKDALASGPACVRYLYDAHGNVLFGAVPANAKIVPASALLSKAGRRKWALVASIVAFPVIFEACGGNAGGYGGYAYEPSPEADDDDDADAGPVRAAPKVETQKDGSADAAADGGVTSDAAPEAGMKYR